MVGANPVGLASFTRRGHMAQTQRDDHVKTQEARKDFQSKESPKRKPILPIP
jgi:hypothetical protein